MAGFKGRVKHGPLASHRAGRAPGGASRRDSAGVEEHSCKVGTGEKALGTGLAGRGLRMSLLVA